MSNSSQKSGPGSSLLGIGQRLFSTLVGIAETRLKLIIVELEQEKANLLQMLLMVGLIMLFSAFGLMILVILLISSISEQYRLLALAITSGVLFGVAFILGIWLLIKTKRSTLLRHTRNELEKDRRLLEDQQP